ncbi:MAG: disulfide bond formation protein B [Pseudomonadota bacterium]
MGKLSAFVRRPGNLSLAILAISSASLLAALGFEHLGGLTPCALCLRQRTPYYLIIALSLVLSLIFLQGRPAGGMALFTLALFGLIAGAAVLNTYFGIHHVGVEHFWWPGPDSCSGGIAPQGGGGSADDILAQIRQGTVVSCTDVPWSFLGLSMAAYNALISAALALLAITGATMLMLPTNRRRV